MKFICFWDMHSGGYSKTPFGMVLVEAINRETAIQFFNAKFSLDVENDIACNCCGHDFAIHEKDTLEEANKFADAYCRSEPFKFFFAGDVSDYLAKLLKL